MALARISAGEVADLTLGLGQINSPPGKEAEIASYVHDWFAGVGIPAEKQEVLPGRFNVIARLKGTGGGQSLILNSHFDTAYGDPMDIWTAGRLNRADVSAWREEDRIYGQGVVNDKAPMAATMMAMKTLAEGGFRGKGDLIFAGVCGEIGRAPVDEYQGPLYEGKGIGSRYAVTHGVLADHALVAECTNWSYTAVECGCLFVRLSLPGRAVYTPFLERPETEIDHPNAIVRASVFIRAFEKWAVDYERRYTYRSPSGLVIPKASIGAIRGGLPYKPIETAGVCVLYLDIRVPAGLEPTAPLRELEQLVAATGLEAELEPFLFRRGYEGRNTETLEQAILAAHRRYFSQPPAEPPPPVSSMWRDLNVFNEVGIPSVTYGPPLGLSAEGWSYYMETEDILLAARIYALIAANVCNRAAG